MGLDLHARTYPISVHSVSLLVTIRMPTQCHRVRLAIPELLGHEPLLVPTYRSRCHRNRRDGVRVHLGWHVSGGQKIFLFFILSDFITTVLLDSGK